MDSNPAVDLPAPAFYLPLRDGKYSVAPGLTHLSDADFGNGPRDRHVFQFDREFSRFRANKLRVRAGGDIYRRSGRADFTSDIASAVTRVIVDRLTAEHPRLFSCREASDGAFSLSCALTGETLTFNSDASLAEPWSTDDDALGALCAQFPEDIAVLHRGMDSGDRIVALDVCAPSHWAPEEKLGRSFDATHVPVPGMERSRAAATGLVNAMIHRPPTVRFTWGIEFSDTLDQHPAVTTAARGFADGQDARAAPLFLRVERQTIWGLPQVDAALFAIRVYIYDAANVIKDRPDRRNALAAALRSMSAESRLYKGLPPATFDVVLSWLDAHGG